jgi:hypothetical protein
MNITKCKSILFKTICGKIMQSTWSETALKYLLNGDINCIICFVSFNFLFEVIKKMSFIVTVNVFISLSPLLSLLAQFDHYNCKQVVVQPCTNRLILKLQRYLYKHYLNWHSIFHFCTVQLLELLTLFHIQIGT